MANEEKGFQKNSINWYPGHMAKAKRLIREKLDVIDIVFEVLDARMPYSSKIPDLDQLIKNKPRLLILTKYDLCDEKETNKWIQFYKEQGYGVLPVNLMDTKNVTKEIISLTERLLHDENEKRLAKGLRKRRARALVVGIPNVGKSTLINRLAGKKVVNVGNKPGVTKSLDWIRVNEDLELLDTPGILWPKLEEETVAFNLATFTAIKEEILPLDEVAVYILKMLSMHYPSILEARYGVTHFDVEEIEDVFIQIGKRRGCLMRGGEVDYDKVITILLNDIKNGFIKGVTFDFFDECKLISKKD